MKAGFGLTPSKSTTEYARAFPSGSRKKITIMIITGMTRTMPSRRWARLVTAGAWLARRGHQPVGFL